MSRMSELFIDIQEKLEDGINPVKIATDLHIPLYFVYNVEDHYYEDIRHNPILDNSENNYQSFY